MVGLSRFRLIESSLIAFRLGLVGNQLCLVGNRLRLIVFRPGQVEVPTGQLLDLLQSMLRMQDLALIDADIAGWMRIIRTADMQRHVREISDTPLSEDAGDSNYVVTQVVSVASSDLKTIVPRIRGFLSSAKASIIEVPERRMLMVTDYESAIAKALKLIELLDTQPAAADVVSITARNHKADDLAARVTLILADKAKLTGTPSPAVVLHSDPERNTILLIGSPADIDSARTLIEQLDAGTSEAHRTVVYAPRYITADRLLMLVESVLVSDLPEVGELKHFLDPDTNRLYVTGPEEMHARLPATFNHPNEVADRGRDRCRGWSDRHAVSFHAANTYVERRVRGTDSTDTHQLMNSV